MSWIIQNLWNNRERIKNKSRRDIGIAYNFAAMYGNISELDEETIGYDDPFIESDEFNDLLIVEKAIKELIELNLLSEEDVWLLNNVRSGNHSRKNTKRVTSWKKLNIIYDRIAYYLGDYFTDEGYLSYLQHKYKLTNAQVQLARMKIDRTERNKISEREQIIEINHGKVKLAASQM